MMRFRPSTLPSRLALRRPATTRSDSRACSCLAIVARMAITASRNIPVESRYCSVSIEQCLGAMTYGSKQWRPRVLEEEEARPFIRKALESGINYFDTADMYSVGKSEDILGRALKEFGSSRDRVIVATKVYNAMSDDPNDKGLSRKHIMHSIDNSLRRLDTDYVDLYQIHRF